MLRGTAGVAAWAAKVLAFVYLTFYGALDVLAGIGNGLVMMRQPTEAVPILRLLFAEGNVLAEVGVWAFLLACLLTCWVLYRRSRRGILPGALLLSVAAVSFLSSHIYFPRGVLTMLVMALGLALLTGAL